MVKPKLSRQAPNRAYEGVGLRVLPAMVDALMPILPPTVQDYGRKIYGALLARQYDRAVELADSVLEQQYEDPRSTWGASQLAHFVRKVPFEHENLTPERTAIKKFLAAEHRCRRVNQRFRALVRRDGGDHRAFLQRARRYIRSIIGATPDMESIYGLCGFGPGASVGVHGDLTSFVQKLGHLSCTQSAASYGARALWENYQAREYLHPKVTRVMDRDVFMRYVLSNVLVIVRGNKITFVPKTAKTHRSIAIEPTVNGFVQKGIDEYMRRCLKTRAGIDLTNQEQNQEMARAGSLPGQFNPWVTLDLSAASDSLATEVVRYLLPPAWFALLNSLRSHYYELEGVERMFHKFTSMGNGFCFPLETLIFASLAYAANVESRQPTQEEVECASTNPERLPALRDWYDRFSFRCYGDDIIVRQQSALLLTEYLAVCGFKLNRDKSFLFGPFRESCGADYFEGTLVRPLVMDELPSDRKGLYKILNGITKSPYPMPQVWDAVYNFVKAEDRLLRPVDGQDDAAITVPLDVFMASDCGRWSRALSAWQWRELLTLPVNEGVPDPLAHYGALHGCSSQNGRAEVSYRRKTRTVTRWVPGDRPTHSKSEVWGFWFVGPRELAD